MTIDKIYRVAACGTIDAHRQYISSEISSLRYMLERRLAENCDGNGLLRIAGICPVCKTVVMFSASTDDGSDIIDGVRIPNWREQLLCSTCGLNNRQRLAAAYVLGVAAARSSSMSIYVTEQVTALFSQLRSRLPALPLIGSEYLGTEIALGSSTNGTRHEDLQKLSFESASFDLVVSCDVLEHVPEPDRAMHEICRVLKPGGELLLSVPFFCSDLESRTRALIVNGAVTHLLPPDYHGNPLSPQGSLVYTEFGWDILAKLRDAGFSSSEVRYYWSLEHGHLGVLNSLIHCVR
jgi:SAM-dependent methyltransferase